MVGTPDGGRVFKTLTLTFVEFILLVLYIALEAAAAAAVDGMAATVVEAAMLAGIVAFRGDIEIILSCLEMNLGVKELAG